MVQIGSVVTFICSRATNGEMCYQQQKELPCLYSIERKILKIGHKLIEPI